MKVDLGVQEWKILLTWAEDATGGYVGIGSSFVTLAESRLIDKLEAAHDKCASGETPPGEDENDTGSGPWPMSASRQGRME